MKKVLFTATVDSHILHFHIPYLKYFKENGYEVHVATSEEGEIPYCDKKWCVSFRRSPLRVKNISAIFQLKKILKEEKYDIIHTHTPMGSVITRISSIDTRKKNKTRIMYTAHGFHFFKGAPCKNWLIFYPVERFLSKYTDDLITINSMDYELASRKFKTKNVYMVNGVGVSKEKFDISLSLKEKNKLRKEFGINPNEFVIIYVAELIKRKNQQMAIKAMEEICKVHKDIKLLLVGKGALEKKYKKQIEKAGLSNKVILAGYRKDVPMLMKISNVALSTSKMEGLPVNLIEAEVSGLPIIATDCRGNRDVTLNGKDNRLIEIDDIQALIDSVEYMYSNYGNINGTTEQEYEKYLLPNVMHNIEKIYNIKKQEE